MKLVLWFTLWLLGCIMLGLAAGVIGLLLGLGAATFPLSGALGAGWSLMIADYHAHREAR